MATHPIPEVDATIWAFGQRMAERAETLQRAGTALDSGDLQEAMRILQPPAAVDPQGDSNAGTSPTRVS